MNGPVFSYRLMRPDDSCLDSIIWRRALGSRQTSSTPVATGSHPRLLPCHLPGQVLSGRAVLLFSQSLESKITPNQKENDSDISQVGSTPFPVYKGRVSSLVPFSFFVSKSQYIRVFVFGCKLPIVFAPTHSVILWCLPCLLSSSFVSCSDV